jgi:hypothetical protein
MNVDSGTMLLKSDVCGDDDDDDEVTVTVTGWDAWRWKTR